MQSRVFTIISRFLIYFSVLSVGHPNGFSEISYKIVIVFISGFFRNIPNAFFGIAQKLFCPFNPHRANIFRYSHIKFFTVTFFAVVKSDVITIYTAFCRTSYSRTLVQKSHMVSGYVYMTFLSSLTLADNGPLTPPDEGLSYIISKNGNERILLRDAVDELKGKVIGEVLWSKYKK